MDNPDAFSLEYPDHPELAIASLLHLLTRVADKSNSLTRQAIAAHLAYLASDERQPAALREAAQSLANDWAAEESTTVLH